MKLHHGVIYCLTNRINNKQYFGQTTEIFERYLKGHRQRVKNNSKQYIHRAIRKYGWDIFKLWNWNA